jgi:hypothetical protein
MTLVLIPNLKLNAAVFLPYTLPVKGNDFGTKYCTWSESFHLGLYKQIKLKISTNSQSKTWFSRLDGAPESSNLRKQLLEFCSHLRTRSKSSDFIMSHVLASVVNQMNRISLTQIVTEL